MDSITKSRDNKTKATVKTKSHKTTECVLSGLNYERDKKKSAESTQQIATDFDVCRVLGALKAHFPCS